VSAITYAKDTGASAVVKAMNAMLKGCPRSRPDAAASKPVKSAVEQTS